MNGLRLMVYDRTDTGRPYRPGLSHSWAAGGPLYRILGRLDAYYGAATWEEALTWLITHRPQRTISEIQFWGHGKWGCINIDRVPLDRHALEQGHAYHARLVSLRARMDPGPQTRWWFRTCETFGAEPGHEFARAFTRFFGCRAAGHTYIIGPWQSGLHSLGPDEDPSWSVDEGLLEGSARNPSRAKWSKRGEPNTVTFLTGDIPAGY